MTKAQAVQIFAPEFEGLLSAIWWPKERLAWAPPEDLMVSEWALRYRVLPTRLSAEPGPWTHRPHYVVEVMDAFTDPRVERITIMASVQSAKTEAVYNMLGWVVCQDPGPFLMVMPTLDAVKKVNERVKLMIEDSPSLLRHLTDNPDDVRQKEISLDRMSIYFATAGSSVDLRNIQARYVLMDEIDDFPPGTGEQGSPIEMAEARTTTFWNRKIITLCTPTTEAGYINVEYERSDRGRFWVPCPHCSGFQVLSFWQIKHVSEERGKWPKDKRHPHYIRSQRVARYECIWCKEEIDDADKPAMLRAGKWIPEGHPIAQDGTTPPIPESFHRGYWWSALYSPWRTFSEIAAQFFATKDDPEKYKPFVNLWLAEVWKESVSTMKSEEILALRTDLPPMVAPADTIAITAGVDMQKYGFWFTLWAWSKEMVASLIHYGYLPDWEDLWDVLLERSYPISGSKRELAIWRAALDTGGGKSDEGWSRTEEAYEMLRLHGRRVLWGVKGLSQNRKAGVRVRHTVLDKIPTKQGAKAIPGGLVLWLLDTDALKDAFFWRMHNKRIRLHADVQEDFASHLLAEETRRNRAGQFEWVKIKRENHLLDASIYGHACADSQWAGGLRPFIEAANAKEQQPAEKPQFQHPSWIPRQQGSWLQGRR